MTRSSLRGELPAPTGGIRIRDEGSGSGIRRTSDFGRYVNSGPNRCYLQDVIARRKQDDSGSIASTQYQRLGWIGSGFSASK